MRDAGARVPELDGLRGLAVVAVVAYHAWPATVPGGWIGVSLFFTLSGFLITGILIRDHEPTRLSMGIFWARRARRLLPAALVAILASLLATAAVDPDSVRRVAGDALASVLYVQNWREAAAPGGYEAIFDTGLRPLAHMWSLAIEEQVYVVLPLAVLWLGPRRMLVSGGLVALAGSVMWWGSPDAYYATPVRLVEVLAGAFLAWWLADGRALRLPPAVPVAGGAVLALGVATLHESSVWVSQGALVVAAAASVAVIAGAVERDIGPLRSRPLTWLGHRSYAIYLVHWPLLVLTDLHPLAVVVATLLVAEASHHLLEWPIRSGRLITSRVGPAFAVLSGVAGGVAVAALVFAPAPASDAEVADATSAALEALVAEAPPERLVDVSSETTAPLPPAGTPEGTDPDDGRIAVAANPHVLMIGDSTAVAVEPAVQGWVAVGQGTYSSGAVNHCSPVFTPAEYAHWSTVLLGRPRQEPCRAVVGAGVDLVVVVDHGMPLFDHFDHRVDEWVDITHDSFRATVEAAYLDTIEEAAGVGATVVLTTPPTPKVVFHSSTEPARRTTYLAMLDRLAAGHHHVHVVDWGTAVDADPERYPRADGLHLDRETGAVHAVVDILAPAFRTAD